MGARQGAIGAPMKSTVELVRKLLPFRMMVVAVLPSMAEVGLMLDLQDAWGGHGGTPEGDMPGSP